MKKKTLLFDASVIAENLHSGRGRSGIYFTTYNILKNLIKSDAFDISLYCSTETDENFVNFVHDNFGEIPICLGNKYSKLLKKLSVLDGELRAKKHNILKLLLNVFLRKPIKFIGKVSKTPKFDIAFSTFRSFDKKIKAKYKYILLHDTIPLLFPEYYPEMNTGKYWYTHLINYIKSKDTECKYFSNSVSTKNDFIRLLDMNPDDITVTPLAAGDNFYPETDITKIAKICKKYNIPTDKKYVFSLCTLEPRKNLIRAVKTFIEFIKKNNIEDMVFVLGGAHWDEFIGKLESEIKDLGKYKDKIIRAGYIDDEDLAALYSGAEWFVYTSQYEGFGLPPLEAMQCGCPVITSNNSSLPEVVGNAAITIYWDSDEQHIAAYEKYYTDKKYRQKMADAGLKRSKEFSWKNTVDIIIDGINKGF